MWMLLTPAGEGRQLQETKTNRQGGPKPSHRVVSVGNVNGSNDSDGIGSSPWARRRKTRMLEGY